MPSDWKAEPTTAEIIGLQGSIRRLDIRCASRWLSGNIFTQRRHIRDEFENQRKSVPFMTEFHITS